MGISRKGGRGMKKSMDHDGVVPWEGRGREDRSQPEKDLLPLQNTNGKKNMDDIEMILTETVVKEVWLSQGFNVQISQYLSYLCGCCLILTVTTLPTLDTLCTFPFSLV